MDTLITFLNVCACLWLVGAGATYCWALYKISTQSALSRQVFGRYTLRVEPWFFPVILVCIAWLITTQLLVTQ